MTKVCTTCGLEKTAGLFRVLRNQCKACESMECHNRGIKHLFSHSKSRAKKGGRCFELSFEQFKQFRNCVCHYCGGVLPERGSGLDRKNSNEGYTLNNVLPCCGKCNKAKLDMPYEDFNTFIAPGFRALRLHKEAQQPPKHEVLIKEFGAS